MKSLRVAAIVAVVGIGAQLFGQTSDAQVRWDGAEKPARSQTKMSAAEFRLLTLKHILEAGGSPLRVGNAQLHRAGDQAAVDLVKIIGSRKQPLSATETLTLLERPIRPHTEGDIVFAPDC